MRKLLALAAFVAAPTWAQNVATLPTTCNATYTNCVQATPVVNPDGSTIGASGGGGAVTIANGAAVPIGSTTDNRNTSTDTTAATLVGLTKQTNFLLGSGILAQGNVASLAADSGNPIKTGGVYSNAAGLTAATAGNRVDTQTDNYGNERVALASYAAAPTAAGTTYGFTYNRTTNATTQIPYAVGIFGWDGTNARPVYSDANNNMAVATRGGATIATGQVSVGTTATLIAAARLNRQKIGVTVTTAVQCAFGNSGVTLTTGWPLAAVAYVSDSWDTSVALYGVCASTATVGYREQY